MQQFFFNSFYLFFYSLLGVKTCASHAQICLHLGVNFKILDEHPHLFYIRVPLLPRALNIFL